MQAQIQAETTFAAIADEFCEKRRRDGQKAWAPATATRSEYLLSLLKGSIGKLPIADIEPTDVLSAVRNIEGKGKLESARRTLQLASAVFRYAVATARLSSDPTRDLRGALTAPIGTHYGAIIDPVRVGELLRVIDGYEGQPITKLAMQLAPHVFVRPGELRHAEWAEFDQEGALWTIAASKTTMRSSGRWPTAIAIRCGQLTIVAPTGRRGWPWRNGGATTSISSVQARKSSTPSSERPRLRCQGSGQSQITICGASRRCKILFLLVNMGSFHRRDWLSEAEITVKSL